MIPQNKQYVVLGIASLGVWVCVYLSIYLSELTYIGKCLGSARQALFNLTSYLSKTLWGTTAEISNKGLPIPKITRLREEEEEADILIKWKWKKEDVDIKIKSRSTRCKWTINDITCVCCVCVCDLCSLSLTHGHSHADPPTVTVWLTQTECHCVTTGEQAAEQETRHWDTHTKKSWLTHSHSLIQLSTLFNWLVPLLSDTHVALLYIEYVDGYRSVWYRWISTWLV